MRYFSLLFFLLISAFVAGPYVSLYLLNDALMENDEAALTKYIDLEKIRDNHKKALAKQTQQMQQALGSQGSLFGNLLQSGAQALGDAAVEQTVTLASVREALRPPIAGDAYPSLFDALSFAFFESPTRFQVRLGELGENPVHFYLMLQDWNWRVAAVYN